MATTASTTRDAVVEAGRTLKRQVYLQPAGSAHLEKIPEDWTRTPDHESQTQLRSERIHLERMRGEMLMDAAAIDAPPRGLQGQRDPGTTPLPVVRDGAEPLAAAAATARRDFDLSATGTVRRKSDLDAFKRQLLTHGDPPSATLRDAAAAVAATSTGLPASPQRHRLGSTGSPAGTAKFAALSSPLRPNTHAGSRMAASSSSASFAASPAVVAPYAQQFDEQRVHGQQHDRAENDDGLASTAALLAGAADRDGHADSGGAAGASHHHSRSASPTRRPRTTASASVAHNHMRYGAGDTTVGSVSISSASQWPHRGAHLVSMGDGGFLTRPGEGIAYGTALVSGRKGGAAGGGPTPHAPYAPPVHGAGFDDALEEPAILPDHMIKPTAGPTDTYARSREASRSPTRTGTRGADGTRVKPPTRSEMYGLRTAAERDIATAGLAATFDGALAAAADTGVGVSAAVASTLAKVPSQRGTGADGRAPLPPREDVSATVSSMNEMAEAYYAGGAEARRNSSQRARQALRSRFAGGGTWEGTVGPEAMSGGGADQGSAQPVTYGAPSRPGTRAGSPGRLPLPPAGSPSRPPRNMTADGAGIVESEAFRQDTLHARQSSVGSLRASKAKAQEVAGNVSSANPWAAAEAAGVDTSQFGKEALRHPRWTSTLQRGGGGAWDVWPEDYLDETGKRPVFSPGELSPLFSAFAQDGIFREEDIKATRILHSRMGNRALALLSRSGSRGGAAAMLAGYHDDGGSVSGGSATGSATSVSAAAAIAIAQGHAASARALAAGSGSTVAGHVFGSLAAPSSVAGGAGAAFQDAASYRPATSLGMERSVLRTRGRVAALHASAKERLTAAGLGDFTPGGLPDFGALPKVQNGSGASVVGASLGSGPGDGDLGATAAAAAGAAFAGTTGFELQQAFGTGYGQGQWQWQGQGQGQATPNTTTRAGTAQPTPSPSPPGPLASPRDAPPAAMFQLPAPAPSPGSTVSFSAFTSTGNAVGGGNAHGNGSLSLSSLPSPSLAPLRSPSSSLSTGQPLKQPPPEGSIMTPLPLPAHLLGGDRKKGAYGGLVLASPAALGAGRGPGSGRPMTGESGGGGGGGSVSAPGSPLAGLGPASSPVLSGLGVPSPSSRKPSVYSLHSPAASPGPSRPGTAPAIALGALGGLALSPACGGTVSVGARMGQAAPVTDGQMLSASLRSYMAKRAAASAGVGGVPGSPLASPMGGHR